MVVLRPHKAVLSTNASGEGTSTNLNYNTSLMYTKIYIPSSIASEIVWQLAVPERHLESEEQHFLDHGLLTWLALLMRPHLFFFYRQAVPVLLFAVQQQPQYLPRQVYQRRIPACPEAFEKVLLETEEVR